MTARVIQLRPELSKTAEGRVLALEGPLWELIKRRWEHRLMSGHIWVCPTFYTACCHDCEHWSLTY
jgi:hypothetical protein